MRSLLCLHGSGGSALEFSVLSAWAAKNQWKLDAIDAPSGTGKWWTYPPGQRSFTASSYSGADASIEAVETALIAGKHDGVLGFSQGAMLAAIIGARSALGEGPPVAAVVLCSGATPKPFEPLLHRLRDTPSARPLPTLHTLCKADPMNPAELGAEVASCFPESATLWHDGGHALPPPSHLDAVAAFLDRAVPASKI